MKTEEGKHREHNDDQTDEIDDTVHGVASSIQPELRASYYVPPGKQLFSEFSLDLGLYLQSGTFLVWQSSPARRIGKFLVLRICGFAPDQFPGPTN
jgi:hypothetical protein